MKTVLFACVHNAGRSQIAEALFNSLANREKARAVSAGTHPVHAVHPNVIEVLSELGIDISKAKPKKLTSKVLEEADLFITMGCKEDCPYTPHLEQRQWQIGDTYKISLDEARKIRQQLQSLIKALIKEKNFGK